MQTELTHEQKDDFDWAAIKADAEKIWIVTSKNRTSVCERIRLAVNAKLGKARGTGITFEEAAQQRNDLAQAFLALLAESNVTQSCRVARNEDAAPQRSEAQHTPNTYPLDLPVLNSKGN